MSKILFLFTAFLFIAFVFTQVTSGAEKHKDYIIVLKDDVDGTKVTDELESRHKVRESFRYQKVIKGFAANISETEVDKLRKDQRVEFVSEDREVFTTSHLGLITSQAVQTIPTGYSRVEAQTSSNLGDVVGVAVIDTGVNLDHPDLAANIVANKNCLRPTRSGDDDNGHGSHVAGTIAAANNSFGSLGIADKAKLAAVKVLNSAGSGTWSSVICGIDWSLVNKDNYNIKVLNLSLGGGGTSDNNCGNTNSDALHKAICRARDGGLTVVVAAGNSTVDASSFVPAAYDDAVITVSALADSDGKKGGLGPSTRYGADDTFASFSNFGSVVDLGAPGVSIYSTYKRGGYATLSGTSMATPHVSAAAAIYLKNNPGAPWNQVRDALVALGEALGSGHSDPSGKHPEPVLNLNAL